MDYQRLGIKNRMENELVPVKIGSIWGIHTINKSNINTKKMRWHLDIEWQEHNFL